MKSLLIILVCVLGGMACSKDKGEKDIQNPTIDFIGPANNRVFNAGETVFVIGTILDDTKVIEMHIHVSNNLTGALLIDIHRYPDVAYYMFDESFQAQAGIQYKIQVIASDKVGKQDIKSVLVSCN